MKTKTSIMLMIVLLASLAVNGQPGKQDRRQNMKRGMRQMMENRFREEGRRVDFFTAEQKTAIRELRLENAKKVKPLRNELQEMIAHQHTLTTAEKTNMNAIDRNIEKMAELRAKIAKIQVRQHQEIRAMLTGEQRLIFDEMTLRKEKNSAAPFRNQRGGRG